MRRSSFFHGMHAARVLSLAVLLAAGCAESGPVDPAKTWDLTASREVGVPEEAPDSGEVVVYPYDGPAWADDEAGGPSALAARAAVPNIRIGVVETADVITLGSPSGGEYAIRDKANGMVLIPWRAGAGAAAVSLVARPVSVFRLQVMCGSAAAVTARKAAAEARGHVTFTEFVPTANCTRLYIGELPSSSTAAERTAFRNLVIAQGLAASDSFYRQVTIGSETVYRVKRGNDSARTVNPVIVTSPTGLITINGATYRERGEARINSTATLAGINELPVEQYLYGVVPRELGPVAFPEVEAQKAQAVAARTFAIANFGRRAADGYDLRATTADQVYGGYAAEHPVSTAAVDDTRGIVATHPSSSRADRLISTLYHSTSGGHTADNEEAFVGAPAAYLRGVPDAERGQALDHVPTLEVFKAHANATSLRAAKEGDFDSDWGRFHRWTFEWTMAEMTRVISDFAPGNDDVGAVTAINVRERGPSGRVLVIDYVTAKAGTITATRDGAIRASLRFFNAQGAPSNLLSTLFFIEPVHDKKTGELRGYRAYGGGFGHGVGMSQTGAVGMAEKGHSYQEILGHYYRGVELVDWYDRS